jgi:hypothetical protein
MGLASPVTVLALLLLTVVVWGCSSATTKPSDAPTRGPDVVIPKVTPEQSKAAEKEEPAPTGDRDPIATRGEDVPEIDSTEDPWRSSGSSYGSRGGRDCDRAADCCLRYYQTTGSDPSVFKTCQVLRIAPTSLCGSMLSSYQQLAPSVGASCN